MFLFAQVTAAATEELAPFVELLTSGGAGRGVTHNVNTYFHLISAGAPSITAHPCPPTPVPAGTAGLDTPVALMHECIPPHLHRPVSGWCGKCCCQ